MPVPWKDQLCLTICLDLWNGAIYRGNSGAAGDRLSPHTHPRPEVPGRLLLECHSTEMNWATVAYLCPGPMIPGDIDDFGVKRVLIFMSWALREIVSARAHSITK